MLLRPRAPLLRSAAIALRQQRGLQAARPASTLVRTRSGMHCMPKQVIESKQASDESADS